MGQQQSDLPDFPLFEMDDPEWAFGCEGGRYVNHHDAHGISMSLRPLVEVANALFFNGGKLADHGLRVKPDLDARLVHRAISALLKSFIPPHQAKESTVALALHHWCEKIPADSAEAA